MNDQQKAEALSRSEFFGKLRQEDLLTLARDAELIPIKRGDDVYRHGSEPGELLIVVEGSVDLLRAGGDVVDTRDATAPLGEMALLDQQPRMVSARAKTDCNVLKLDGQRFLNLLHANADVREAVFDFMSKINRRLVRESADKGVEMLRLLASAMRRASGG